MLIKDVTLGEFGYEGVMDFPLFNCKIGIHFNKDVTLKYAEKCAVYLNNMSDDTIERLCAFSIRYCEGFREYFEDEEIAIPVDVKSKEIMQYIRPSFLVIPIPKNENIAFHMELNCDWEPEHGMEWSINNGDILYVGAFSDENPWRDKEYFKTVDGNYALFEK